MGDGHRIMGKASGTGRRGSRKPEDRAASLEQSEERFRTLVELAPEAMVILAVLRNGRLDPGISLLEKPFSRRDLGTAVHAILDAHANSH